MKARFSSILSTATLLLFNTCSTLEEIAAVPTVSVTTQMSVLPSQVVTGEIKQLGDGITNHGHVWSSTNSPPTITDNASDLGEKLEPGKFSTTINLFNAAKTHVRAYARDVHGRYFYGDVMTIGKVTAGFGVVNDGCKARCTMTFNNQSTTNATTFKWNFGDGSPEGNLASVSHDYALPGTYHVTLIASGADILADTISKDVTVSVATFEKTYPGFGAARQIIQLPNEGFVIAGMNTDGVVPGLSTIYLVFINKLGEFTKSKTLGISGMDWLGNMIMLSSGALAFVGNTPNDAVSYTELLYMKTDLDGNNIVNPRRIEITTGNDSGIDLAEIDNCGFSTDCGILITGQVVDPTTGKSSVRLTKINSAGDVIFFSKTIPGSELKTGFDIMSMGDNIFIAGNSIATWSYGALWKLDAAGNLAAGFPRTYNIGQYDYLFSIAKTSATELMMTGPIGGAIGDIMLVKTDLNGAPLSSFPKAFGTATDLERPNSMVTTSDGNLFITGQKNGNAYILKITNAGVKVWDKEFGGSQVDYFASGINTADGGFIAVGSKDDVLYVVKTDNKGSL